MKDAQDLIKRLERSVLFAECNNENMDDVSWGMQEGILISYNEAKIIIEALKDVSNEKTDFIQDDQPKQKEYYQFNIRFENGYSLERVRHLANGNTPQSFKKAVLEEFLLKKPQYEDHRNRIEVYFEGSIYLESPSV